MNIHGLWVQIFWYECAKVGHFDLVNIILLPVWQPWLGLLIFGSKFWDPHRKQNSDSIFDSKDSGWNFFLKFRCLESQKIGIPIPKFGIPVPHKKTDTYSSVDTKVHGRKPLPYKMAGELFFLPNLHLLTLIGKRTYIYSHLTENEQ